MTGPIGLHGGAEYAAGDEPFLDALLVAARSSRADPEEGDVAGHSVGARVRTLRIVILPTAAGRGRPDVAAATGQIAFERRARVVHPDVDVRIEVARVVDPWSAADPETAERLIRADLIHLPGGDPDLIPSVLAGTAALAAIDAAWRAGAVLAGASAGAMALAEWTWTPHGGVRALGFVRGLAVVPHYDDVRRTRWQQALDEVAPGGLGYLGLDERTGVLSEPNGPGGRAWRVAGPGAAHWFARGATEAITVRHGDVLNLPA